MILMAVAAAAQGTAIAVAQDMTEGIIARFRTMAVARSSVLTGHVVGATIQTLIGVVVVTAAAIAVGFRPHANAAEWLPPLRPVPPLPLPPPGRWRALGGAAASGGCDT